MDILKSTQAQPIKTELFGFTVVVGNLVFQG